MRSRRFLPVLLAICLGALSAAGTGSPSAEPVAGYKADAPFIRDAAGRARFFHGVNAVWKGHPYYPPSSVYAAPYAVPLEKSFFDERDGAFLRDNGLNSVRLGSLWVGTEPEKDVFDEAYLDRIQELVRMLGDYDVTVVVDSHQDMFNERFDGEGFPDWATHNAVVLPGDREVTIPPTNCCGFPGNYFTPAASSAFDNLWLDRFGLWDEYRDFWRHTAERFAGEPNLLGYGLFNEPWPGTQTVTCANPLSCPLFDVLFLQPFYENVIEGIREVDPGGMIWWDASVITNNGTLNSVGLSSPLKDPGENLGLSFHAYCLLGGFVPQLANGDDPACPIMNDLVFRMERDAALRNRSAEFLTEFGATDNLEIVARMAELADRYMVSWHWWHYGEWSDPTTSGTGGVQGLFASDLDRPGSLKQAKADILIRTYPQAVAGTPTGFSFDPATGEFVMTFEADPSIDAPTEIFVPVDRHYGGSYEVEVSGPALVTSAPDAPLLTLSNTGAGTVTVRVG
ncbi:MAG: cellulase family glycosylhydrolase [Actinomycetota bacterium]